MKPTAKGRLYTLLRNLDSDFHKGLLVSSHLFYSLWDGLVTKQTEIIRVDSKGRISIPRALREHLNLNQGVELEISENKGTIVLAPLAENPVDTIFDVLSRALPEGKTATEILHELRAEWDQDLDKEASRD